MLESHSWKISWKIPRLTLASNQGALQYADALIQGVTEGQDDVGVANVSEEITAEPVEVMEAEEVQL